MLHQHDLMSWLVNTNQSNVPTQKSTVITQSMGYGFVIILIIADDADAATLLKKASSDLRFFLLLCRRTSLAHNNMYVRRNARCWRIDFYPHDSTPPPPTSNAQMEIEWRPVWRIGDSKLSKKKRNCSLVHHYFLTLKHLSWAFGASSCGNDDDADEDAMVHTPTPNWFCIPSQRPHRTDLVRTCVRCK